MGILTNNKKAINQVELLATQSTTAVGSIASISTNLSTINGKISETITGLENEIAIHEDLISEAKAKISTLSQQKSDNENIIKNVDAILTLKK